MNLKTVKQKMRETNIWFFKNINKIYKLLARLTKKEMWGAKYQYQEWNIGYHKNSADIKKLREYW